MLLLRFFELMLVNVVRNTFVNHGDDFCCRTFVGFLNSSINSRGRFSIFELYADSLF